MADQKITEIVSAAVERYRLCAVAAEHRTGIVPLSEPSIAVAVSAPHRKEAFASAQAIIAEVKAQAPIRKKGQGGRVRGHDSWLTRGSGTAACNVPQHGRPWRRRRAHT